MRTRKPKLTRKRTLFVVVTIIVVVGATVAGVTYFDQLMPLRTRVLVVNDRSFRMDYLVNRTRMSGNTPVATLQAITREEIVRQVVTDDPYNIEVSAEDVDEYLERSAQGSGPPLEEGEFDAWYRGKLNQSGLSEGEYRELVETNLLFMALREHLDNSISREAQQVKLYGLVLAESVDAGLIQERLRSGDDFEELVREFGADGRNDASGGELGWFARGTLPGQVEAAVFDGMEVGEISDPLAVGQDWMLFKVADRAFRDVDARTYGMLQSMALEEWFRDEMRNHEVTFHGLTNGYDSETEQWIQERLRGMQQ